jgi:transcriptional regulator with XRE-family HTH domain
MSKAGADIDQRAAFGDRLRHFRERRGLTQRFICREAGLSPAYYCEVEAGRRSVGAATLERLADVFGMTMDDLWRGLGRGELPCP